MHCLMLSEQCMQLIWPGSAGVYRAVFCVVLGPAAAGAARLPGEPPSGTLTLHAGSPLGALMPAYSSYV